MIKHCSTIVPPSNFPSEFSTSGKRHNIGLEITQSKIAPSKSDKSDFSKPLIKLNTTTREEN
jgi:hypothetical protein